MAVAAAVVVAVVGQSVLVEDVQAFEVLVDANGSAVAVAVDESKC